MAKPHCVYALCLILAAISIAASFFVADLLFSATSKPIAGRTTPSFAGTPSFTAASKSRTVGSFTAPCTVLSAAQAHREPQRFGTRAQHHSLAQVVLRRLRYQTVRLCEGEVLLDVERDCEPCGDPQVRRQVIEELL